MSRSVITCRDCQQPVAYRHKNGEIVAAEGLRASIHTIGRFSGSLKIVCTCGRSQYFGQQAPRPPDQQAA